MKRRLLNLVTLLSLVLCVGMLVLWVRGYWVWEGVGVITIVCDVAALTDTSRTVSSAHGRPSFSVTTSSAPDVTAPGRGSDLAPVGVDWHYFRGNPIPRPRTPWWMRHRFLFVARQERSGGGQTSSVRVLQVPYWAIVPPLAASPSWWGLGPPPPILASPLRCMLRLWIRPPRHARPLPRVRRHAMSRPANILAAALLASAVAVGALWVRSYFAQDIVHCVYGSRLSALHSCAGTIALVTDSGAIKPTPLRIVREVVDAPPEPVAGGYVPALLHFDADTMPWGTLVIEFPHWPVAVAAAAWPIGRFVRARRRRRAKSGGFPVVTG